MSIRGFPARKILDATEVSYAAGQLVWQDGGIGIYRVTITAVWTGYTAVTVKLVASMDGGLTWSDVEDMSITVSGDVLSKEIGPYALMGIHVTATLSASSDNIKIWYMRSELH